MRENAIQELQHETSVLDHAINVLGRRVPVGRGTDVVQDHFGEQSLDGEQVDFVFAVILDEFFRRLNEWPGKVLPGGSVPFYFAEQFHGFNHGSPLFSAENKPEPLFISVFIFDIEEKPKGADKKHQRNGPLHN